MPDDAELARIEEVIQPVLRDHGLELVDVDWRGVRPRGVLRVFVDQAGGVRVEDCERVSRELGDILDVAGLIEGGIRLGGVLARAGSAPPQGARVPVGDRQAGALLGGRGSGVQRSPGRGGGPIGWCSSARGSRVEVPRAALTKARLDIEIPWARRT